MSRTVFCRKIPKIPLIIACNTENGGNGACSNGTMIGAQTKIGATGDAKYAKALGKMANEEAAAIGCEHGLRAGVRHPLQLGEYRDRDPAFGNDPRPVAQMSKAYMDGLHTIPGFACTAKHFPGNGLDFRDAHLSNNVNTFSVEEWTRPTGWCIKRLLTAVWMPSWAGISCCRSTRGPSIPR